MAHLLRLIVAALFLVAGYAHALLPIGTGYQIPGGSNTGVFESREAACNAQDYAWANGWSTVSRTVTMTGSTYQCRLLSSAGTQWVGAINTVAGACPANSNAVSQTHCQCNTGYHEEGGACVANPPDCTPGEVYSEPSTKDYGPSGDPFGPADFKSDLLTQAPSCAGQCALQVTGGGLPIVGRQFNGRWFIDRAGLSKSGGNCTQTGKDVSDGLKWDQLGDAQNAPPNPCPPGKSPGEVNGTSVCMPSQATATGSQSSSSSTGTVASTGGEAGSSNGGGSGGSGGTDGNGSGPGASIIGESGATNSSDSTWTVCNDTTCTTTTSSSSTASPGSGTGAGGAGSGGTGSGGTGGGAGTGSGTRDCAQQAANSSSAEAGGATCSSETTTEQSRDDYCKANPKAVQCADKQSSFGGTCAGGFVAKSDDAVLNAMAEEQFRQNCKLNPAEGETELAQAERQKTGDQTGDNPNNTSVSISPSSIDTSDALGGGASCIADKSITVLGQTITLKTSEWCQGMPLLGNVLMGIAFLVAAVIILRG